jgi:hypothetical protein
MFFIIFFTFADNPEQLRHVRPVPTGLGRRKRRHDQERLAGAGQLRYPSRVRLVEPVDPRPLQVHQVVCSADPDVHSGEASARERTAAVRVSSKQARINFYFLQSGFVFLVQLTF